MTCEHKRIKSVNCVLFCMDCGAQLPADFQTGKKHPSEPDKAAEAPENVQKKRIRKKV